MTTTPVSARHFALALQELVTNALPNRAAFLCGRDVDAALDDRDQTSFVDEWTRAWDLVCRRPEYDRNELSDIEEAIFRRTFDVYESSDLSAYVSEDVGLLARAMAVGIDDPWIRALHDSYVAGRLPTGNITQA